jgi:Zn-dependent peptidase ImmA (M78 family)
MVAIDRMALADIGNSIAIANAVIQQLGEVPIPVPIVDIAVGAGITEIKPIETTAFEGALITPDDKSTGVILVNGASRPERRRFTVGHELGHFLNPWHTPPKDGFKCTKSDMAAQRSGNSNALAKMEIEANEFSAEMLMPRKLFVRDLRKMKSPGLEHIIDLANRYETSKLATARRFVELNDECTAYVLSKNEVIEHSYRHKDFPFIDLKRGQPVPARSTTAKFGDGPNQCSGTESVEPALWTSKTLRQGAFRITLLSIDESECDDDEDEEYGRPRFR